MLRTFGFSWHDTTKMIECERQSYEHFCKVCAAIYKCSNIFTFMFSLSFMTCKILFCKKIKIAKGLWGVPFSYLDELDKVFRLDRVNGAACENFEEAMHGIQNKTTK